MFEKLRKILRRFNIQHIVIHLYLLDRLNSNLDQTPGDQSPGVYEIPIDMKINDREFYISITKRKFF